MSGYCPQHGAVALTTAGCPACQALAAHACPLALGRIDSEDAVVGGLLVLALLWAC